jgi:hypothetical protein
MICIGFVGCLSIAVTGFSCAWMVDRRLKAGRVEECMCMEEPAAEM